MVSCVRLSRHPVCDYPRQPVELIFKFRESVHGGIRPFLQPVDKDILALKICLE